MQFLHCSPPPVAVNCPAGHTAHVDAGSVPQVVEFGGEAVPGMQSQSLHSLAPVPAENFPAGQAAHRLPPPVENCPDGHSAQFCFAPAEPAVEEASPPGHLQSSQFAWPLFLANCPGLHSVHAELTECPPGTWEYFPAGHCGQVASPVTPAYCPAGQGSHAVAPLERACLPTSHFVHWPWPLISANVPLGQTTQGTAPPGENVPTGQPSHVALGDTALAALDAVPFAHSQSRHGAWEGGDH